MPKTLAAKPSRITLNPALLALKPRQVLLSRPFMAKESSKASSLKSEQKALLLRSIAQYLDRCGFSKCFKKLLSAAEIEKNELNSSALPDLEKVYSEFLNKSNLEAVEVKDESGDASDDHETYKKEGKKKEVAEVSAMEGVEKVKKDKKKKKKVEETDESGDGKEKKAGQVVENASDDQETEKKDKKKEGAEASAMDCIEKVKKDKKKKKKVEVTKEEKVKETDAEVEDVVKEKKKRKKNKSKATETETLGDDEKVSKKRKRSEPEEETKEETKDDEESKRRKKVAEDDMDVQETPVKQTADVQENGNVENTETKSANKKSGKGASNSKEPKKPFQRVNVEEVVFTDDRLKDNSYWAKDGADSGYGAKAQEVLGQVRGRGFRHEKTKKKRGSYRGGEIDLQSHSVKFKYSDDE